MLRYLSAAWLLMGSVGKMWDLWAEPSPSILWITNRWFIAGTCAIELTLVAILLINLYPSIMRWVLVSIFANFSIVHALVLLHVFDSCGCFGGVQVSSWIMLPINAALAVALVKFPFPGTPHVMRRKLILLVLSVFCAVLLAVFLGLHKPTIRANTSVVAEPISLSAFISQIDGIREGEWTIVLYRPDCTHCQQDFNALLMKVDRSPPKRKWCFINVSGKHTQLPSDPFDESLPSFVKRLRFTEYNGVTPSIISVENGVMTHQTQESRK